MKCVGIVVIILQGLGALVVALDIDMAGRVDFICRKGGEYYRTGGTAADGEPNILYYVDMKEKRQTLYIVLCVCLFCEV